MTVTAVRYRRRPQWHARVGDSRRTLCGLEVADAVATSGHWAHDHKCQRCSTLLPKVSARIARVQARQKKGLR